MRVANLALVAIGLAASLGGCVAAWGDSHKVTHRDDTSIVIEADPMFIDGPGVETIAQNHCRSRAGQAVKQSQRKTIAGIFILRYQCERTPDAQKVPVELLRQSLDRFQARDWTQAADLASASIETGSLTVAQAAAAYTIRGFCRLVQGRIAEAQADTNRALQLRPDFKPALQLRALLQEARSPQRGAPRAPRPRGDDELQPPIIQF